MGTTEPILHRLLCKKIKGNKTATKNCISNFAVCPTLLNKMEMEDMELQIALMESKIEALSEDAQLNLAKEESLKCINMEKIYQKVNNFTMKKGMENSLVDYKKEKYIEEIEEILI